jgi:hypothetical protein
MKAQSYHVLTDVDDVVLAIYSANEKSECTRARLAISLAKGVTVRQTTLYTPFPPIVGKRL